MGESPAGPDQRQQHGSESGYGFPCQLSKRRRLPAEIGLEPPEDIVDMVSIEETSPPNAGLSVLEMFKKIRESASANTFDNLPADASRNYKHYIYGLPKK